MPRLTVPLRYAEPSAGEISLSYSVIGVGPILVLLIPGLLVPASMYDELATHLAATGRYTALALDNRGIGESDAPPPAESWAALAAGRGNYSPEILARDAWAVVDHARGENSDGRFEREIGIAGHSMGGMVLQRMLLQRPANVRFAAMLSTHTGGLWNFVPTTTLFLSLLRLAVNRFDANISALVNLDLHFTPHFLDQLIAPAPEIVRKKLRNLEAMSVNVQRRMHKRTTSAELSKAAVIKRRKRRDVYFARYIGHDFDWLSELPGDPHHLSPRGDNRGGRDSQVVGNAHVEEPSSTSTQVAEESAAAEARESEDSENSSHQPSSPRLPSPTADLAQKAMPPPKVLDPLAHFTVVIQHRLTSTEAKRIARCRRLHTVVIAGADDRVITPLASRTLARSVGASAFVEIPGAHFIFDERATQVNQLLSLGLDTAFYPNSAGATAAFGDVAPCVCPWCSGEDVADAKSGSLREWFVDILPVSLRKRFS
jgi:pimeloyl-ACP methyl ester carboxylesterase